MGFKANAARVLEPSLASRVGALLADYGRLDEPDVRPRLAPEGYDVIVCNPPYRSQAQQDDYDREVGEFGGRAEHASALVAGETGLEAYEAVTSCIARDVARCAQGAALEGCAPLLREGGTLIFQLEAGQRGKVGGIAPRVREAVECAAAGRLTVAPKPYLDVNGAERALLVYRC
eukprot:NODE_4651_length_653_cov_250.234114.p1 GENE.NODE_4651_length_653_cov_250.234114~~NODE_4651_length_653_cov_250.234114.p1  ORF type:complete len:175 (+),score=46.76 NODE_4651_length_653_cov_250.234114:25-549(+)